MARVFFSLLLRLYPERLRRERGSEMWETFAQNIVEARHRGTATVLALWLSEIRAALTLGWPAGRYERSRARRAKGSGRHRLLDAFAMDLRYTFRTFRKSPGFVAVVILTLAIGIGSNSAIFSVVNGILLRPLPYQNPDELFMIWGRFLPESGFDLPQFELCEPEVLDFRDESRSFAEIAAFSGTYGITLGGEDREPERRPAAAVTPELFPLLRVAPALGRGFSEEEGRPGGPVRVVVSHQLWQNRFGGRPDILDRPIELNEQAREIVGVMPPGFGFPEKGIDVWTPLQIDPSQDRSYRGNHYLRVLARLGPGATRESAETELAEIMRGWEARYPDVHRGHFLFSRSLVDEIVGDVRPALRTLWIAVAVVLLIACLNVANLLLARSEGREREMAVRTALGAGRLRVVRQLLTESSLLAILGGLAGLLVADTLLKALLAIHPGAIPRTDNVTLDATVLGYAALLTLATAVLFGTAPAFFAHGRRWQRALRSATRGAVPGKFRLGRSLVVVEVALCLVLLAGAGLVSRSFEKLTRVDPGFRSAGTLVARLSLPRARYDEPEAAAAFYRDLLGRLRASPELGGASAASFLPLLDTPPNNDIRIEGRAEPSSGELKPSGNMVIVAPGYFEQMGIELLQGRTFDEADREDRIPVAVISKSLAETFWPGEDPIGQRFDPLFNDVALTIVGIVGDVKHRGLDVAARGAWYFPHQQAPLVVPWSQRSMRLVVQAPAGRDPEALAGPLRAAVREIDPALVVTDVQTMASVRSASVADRRFTATLLGVFAALAMSLGAVGLYGVMSYSVARRRKEIGLRAGLGATRARIARAVLGPGLTRTALGLAIGLAIAVGTSRLLSSILFAVSPTDPTTLGAVTSLLVLVAAIAAWLPARRAARLDPMETLREE